MVTDNLQTSGRALEEIDELFGKEPAGHVADIEIEDMSKHVEDRVEGTSDTEQRAYKEEDR